MTKKLLITSLVATVVAFILGYLLFGMALKGYFEGEMTVGIARADEDMIWWSLILGHVCWGFLLTYIIGKWAGISTFSSGAQAGAIIGLFVGLMINLINYGVIDIMSLTGSLVDSIIMAVIAGITGGVIGMMMGRNKS